jgi:hypothetical protein
VNPSEGCLSNLSRGLAVLIAFIMVISMPIALMAYNLGQVVFSKDKVTQIISDQLIASGEVRRMLVVSFLSNPSPQGTNANDFSLVRAAQDLSPEQMQELTNLLLPEDWFRQQVGSMVGGIYGWLEGDQPRPQLTLDLVPLKERLLGGGAQQLMLLLIDSWPQCLSDQLAQIEQSIQSTRPPAILYCKPPSSLRGIYTERSTIWFTNQVRAMPEKIPLGDQAGASVAELTLLRNRIRLLRDVLRFGWMIPASLLGLIMALAVRSWLGLTRWWGASLAATGMGGLAMIPLARPLETRLLRQLQPGENLPPILMDMLASASDAFRTAVVQALAAQAILLVLIGVGLLIGGWLWSRRRVSAESSGPGTAPAGPLGTSEGPTGLFG